MHTVASYTNKINQAGIAKPWQMVYTKLHAANFTSGVDGYHVKHIVADLKKEYKGTHTPQQIADAVMACCKQRQKKISKEFFLLFVLTKLS